MLTGMFARLKKGQVLKSKADNNGKISYIIILQSKPFFLELYKTTRLSKNWKKELSPLEIKARKYDFTNYTNKIISEKLKLVDDIKEAARLRNYIDSLPEEIQDKIYGGEKIDIFHTNSDNYLYGFEMQRINKLNDKTDSNIESFPKDLSDKLYKKALSIIPILHL